MADSNEKDFERLGNQIEGWVREGLITEEELRVMAAAGRIAIAHDPYNKNFRHHLPEAERRLQTPRELLRRLSEDVGIPTERLIPILQEMREIGLGEFACYSIDD